MIYVSIFISLASKAVSVISIYYRLHDPTSKQSMILNSPITSWIVTGLALASNWIEVSEASVSLERIEESLGLRDKVTVGAGADGGEERRGEERRGDGTEGGRSTVLNAVALLDNVILWLSSRPIQNVNRSLVYKSPTTRKSKKSTRV
jgi:hypothetical protein